MLYEALAQPTIFFFMVVGGIVAGLLFDIKNIFLELCKKNKILSQILMFFAVFSMFFIWFTVNLRFNYGQFRIFSILSFALAFILERFFVENFVANPIVKCYNKFKVKRDEKRKTKKV